VREEIDVTDDDAATQRVRKRNERGLDSMAMRDLRSARKLLKEGDASAAEANFLVASANVLAILDLACAIREANGVSSGD
jgi:hypothetical protein